MQTNKPENGELIAVMKTNNGTMKIRLFLDKAPFTVTNFVGLAKSDYYKDVTFHRVIKNFMIQGGDPDGTGMGGVSFYGKNFKDEFDSELSNIPGALSMANSGPSTNGSQFFIVHKREATYLDGKHSVFGQVYEGMDTIDKIASVKTGSNDKPSKEIKIISLDIKEYKDGTLVETSFDPEKKKEELTAKRPIADGDSITVHYKGTFENGEIFDSSYERGEPIAFTVGEGKMIKGFEDSVLGMMPGEHKEITLEPKDAYGDYDSERIEEIPKEHIGPEFDKIKVGDYVNSVFGPIKAIGKTEESITFDVNHKLAGKTLNFALEIVDIIN